MKKAWELNKVDEIIVEGKTPSSFKLPKKAKDIVNKPITVKEEYVEKELKVVEKKRNQ